ncbi:MAG: protoporphyrinogen oxidase [Planctomycetia bacterium]|nr:protoporphyrinogen oxidase [Planctomycetia bacterium]
MPSIPQTAAPVIVIGGGLAGLTAAEAVVERSRRPVVIIEPRDRTGGMLQTVRRDGWLVERSADCFLAARPEGLDLVRRLGLTDRLIPVEPAARRALILWDGDSLPVPAGFRLLAPGDPDAIRTTPLLSATGRARVLEEPLVPPRDPAAGDESLESFAVRRLGREAFDRLVQPLVAGIWTADPARLSMRAACPEFVQMERDHGSLTAGERARTNATRTRGEHLSSGARYGQFVTLADGCETLPEALGRRLTDAGATWQRTRVMHVTTDKAGYRVHTDGGPTSGQAAAAVVVACPAPAAALVLGGLAPPLAAELAAIEYAGSAVVCLGFDRSAIGHPLDAAGIVVPRVAGRGCLAISFASAKFPGRAPTGGVLVRVFIGGALDPAAALLPDEQLMARALDEARDILRSSAPPCLVEIARWQRAMPQYHLGHAERIARIRSHLGEHPGLTLAGAAYDGVGIPQVIASGRAAGFAAADHCG